MIPYGRQIITSEDVKAVVDVLTSDYLTQGPKVPLFEENVAKYCQVNFACAVNSATSALHISCLALEVRDKDVVWTSPISFVASANCALYCGAALDFVDIDITTGNICPLKLEEKLIMAKKHNRLPKVLIVVHLAGLSADMLNISKLAKQFNFKIIEDASHAIGASYMGTPIGSCKFSDITVFSFHPVKIITSAEGGIAVTNDAKLMASLKLYRSHGVTSDTSLMEGETHGPWYYQQILLGYNYRMTELQGALGASQLRQLNNFVAKRHLIASIYDEAFSNTSLIPLKPQSSCISSYHLYIVLLPLSKAHQQKRIITKLREMKIFAHVHYIPIHTQPFYQKLGFKYGDFPTAEQYYKRAISLPLYPELSPGEQTYIIESLIQCLEN